MEKSMEVSSRVSFTLFVCFQTDYDEGYPNEKYLIEK